MVLQNPDGGYAITGCTYSTGTPYSQAFLVLANSGGNMLSVDFYGKDSDCWANALQRTSDGGYIFAGGKYDPALGDCDAFLVKADSLGNEQWNRTFGGYGDDWASSVLQTADGGYLFTGTYTDTGGKSTIYVKKVFGNGSTDWGNYYYSTSDVWGNSVMSSGDGGYVITGGTLVRCERNEDRIIEDPGQRGRCLDSLLWRGQLPGRHVDPAHVGPGIPAGRDRL